MQKLILMRGLPGSGKSTLAEKLAKELGNTVVCSTDEYFSPYGKYVFIPEMLTSYHMQNKIRVSKLLKQGKNVIVDNTNLQLADMHPYVDMAIHNETPIQIEVLYPNTTWANNPDMCQKYCSKNIPLPMIQNMWNNYQCKNDSNIVDAILSLNIPPHNVHPIVLPYIKPLIHSFSSHQWLPINHETFYDMFPNNTQNVLNTITQHPQQLVNTTLCHIHNNSPFFLPKHLFHTLLHTPLSSINLQSIHPLAPNTLLNKFNIDTLIAPSQLLLSLSTPHPSLY